MTLDDFLKDTLVLERTNCYEAAYELCSMMPEDARVVHGRPRYQGEETPDEDGHYGHAWVEFRGLCFDYSHGHKFVVDVDRYYHVGEIDPSKVSKFSLREMDQQLAIHDTWGLW